MKIRMQDVDAPKDNAAVIIETTYHVTISECYVGIGIETDDGVYGIAQRDGGLEVTLNGELVWNSSAPITKNIEIGENLRAAINGLPPAKAEALLKNTVQ